MLPPCLQNEASNLPCGHRLLRSTPVPLVGKYPSPEQLRSIPDIGDRIAKSVADFLAQPVNRQVIAELKELGINSQETTSTAAEGPLLNRSVVLTGTFLHWTRKQAEQMVAALGGRVVSSVSSKTSLVIYGADPGSKLTKAQGLQLNIMNEQEFLEWLANQQGKPQQVEARNE